MIFSLGRDQIKRYLIYVLGDFTGNFRVFLGSSPAVLKQPALGGRPYLKPGFAACPKVRHLASSFGTAFLFCPFYLARGRFPPFTCRSAFAPPANLFFPGIFGPPLWQRVLPVSATGHRCLLCKQSLIQEILIEGCMHHAAFRTDPLLFHRHLSQPV
jgi:hypothetical protein